jgi:hypothetical protein
MDYLVDKQLPGGFTLMVGTWKSGFHKRDMYQLLCCLDGYSLTRYPRPDENGENCTEDKIMELHRSITTVEDFKRLVAEDSKELAKTGSA